MIKALSLQQLCERFGGELLNGDHRFDRVTTDTRKELKNTLFVALKGDQFDGHNYIDAAIEKGVSALVLNKTAAPMSGNISIPCWLVDDTTMALGHIAEQQRDAYVNPLVGVTGSSGKTTVKGMLACIFSAAVGEGQFFATRGNLNNHFGVPFSLLEINAECQYAVIEMGASAVGEVAILTAIAKPDVALVNNVSGTHLEGFGSLDNIALAKSEIYDGLSEEGIAVINVDDFYAPQWQQKNSHRSSMTFSAEPQKNADVTAIDIVCKKNNCYVFELLFKHTAMPICLSVMGRHNVLNATAAATAALASGISLQHIKEGLEIFSGEPGRLQITEMPNNNTIIDDTYNANPSAMMAAIDVLAGFSNKKILVVGDMGELGTNAEEAHKSIGDYAKKNKIDHLFCLGHYSAFAAKSFGANAFATNNIQVLCQQLEQNIESEACILIKGSRSAHMERVVNYLKQLNDSGVSNASLVG